MTTPNPLAALLQANPPDPTAAGMPVNPLASLGLTPQVSASAPDDEETSQRKELEKLRDKLKAQQDEPSFADTVLKGLLANGLRPDNLSHGQVARNALANFARGALMKENFQPVEQEQLANKLHLFNSQVQAARAQASEEHARRQEGLQLLTGIQRDLYAQALADARQKTAVAALQRAANQQEHYGNIDALRAVDMFDNKIPAGASKRQQEDAQTKLTAARTAFQNMINKDPILATKNPDEIAMYTLHAAGITPNDPNFYSKYTALKTEAEATKKAAKFAPQPRAAAAGPTNYTAPLPNGEGTLLDKLAKRTMSGRAYIDATGYSGKEFANLATQAAAAGVPVVSKDNASTLDDLDTTRQNLKFMLDSIESKLPKDATGRITGGLGNRIDALMQNDPDLAAIGTYRNAAIQAMRSVAGSKGLRINQAEVKLAQENDIPKMTDTVATAQRRVANLRNFLDHIENSLLVQDRSQLPGGTNAGKAPVPTTKPAVEKQTVPAVGGTFNGARVKSVTRID